jgi:hypothetical protein
MGDVVAEALAILTKHKGYAFGLYSNSLGKELAENAISRTAVVNEVFSQIINQGYSNQELIDVSRSFIDSLNPSQMSQILKDTIGAILLVRVKGYLSCYSEKFSSAARCVKIETAFTRTDIEPPPINDKQNNPKSNGNSYYTIDAGIIVEAEAIAILNKIAPEYYKRTGKQFNVNSGTRDAYRQADAMYVKYPRDKSFSEYPNRKLVNEILEAIKKAQATRNSTAGIVQSMTAVIQTQINRREYISKHLIAGCIDIATTADTKTNVPAMSLLEQKIMIEIAIKMTGGTAKKEENPPHIHIQFK